MEECMIVFFIVIILQQTLGENFQLCYNIPKFIPSNNCSSQIWGSNNSDDAAKFDVKNIQQESTECIDSFSTLTPISSSHLGQISIKPFVLHLSCPSEYMTLNQTVSNIVFKGIKWKKLKFKIENLDSIPAKGHCRRLVIKDSMKIDGRTVLHYDCYKSLTEGTYKEMTHVLDLEATDGTVVDRRKFLFYIPSARMLYPNPNETNWKPFVYVENLVTKMRLRIVSPPAILNFTYQIGVMKTSEDCPDGVVVENVTVISHYNDDDEVTFDYTPTSDGLYYFVVTTLHEQCMSGKVECQSVKSPSVPLVAWIVVTTGLLCCEVCKKNEKEGSSLLPLTAPATHFAAPQSRRDHDPCNWVEISTNKIIVLHRAPNPNMLVFYFVIIGSLILVSLLVYLIYCRYCRGPSEIPKPTKVVVIYPSANSVHSECVASFVAYLRSECGLDVSYDGDIPTTFHSDPYFWAENVMREASHIMYIVGPKENENYPNSVHQNVDILLLSFLRAIRAVQPEVKVINVFFEHSNGPVPNETRNDRVFYLMKDWQKLIAYLSRDLLPKKQIMRTDRGKYFIENLTRVKKSMAERSVA